MDGFGSSSGPPWVFPRDTVINILQSYEEGLGIADETEDKRHVHTRWKLDGTINVASPRAQWLHDDDRHREWRLRSGCCGAYILGRGIVDCGIVCTLDTRPFVVVLEKGH